MAHIILIACASRKLRKRSKAADLYISDLFRKSLHYARSLSPDAIYILSAKHGLLAVGEEVEPYNMPLDDMPAAERRAWADRVLRELGLVADLREDQFTFLAGERYREHLLPHIRNTEVPMEGLRIGKQLRFLKAALNRE